MDYQAAAQQVERRREEESSPGARCLHDIAEKTHPETQQTSNAYICKLEEVNELHRPLWDPSQLMKSYRSSVHICDAAQKCRVSFPGSLIRAAQEWDVCILHLGVVTRPKRSTCTDGIRHYCHVLAQYILPMAKVFLATRKESVPPSKLASLYIASIGWMQSFTYIHTLCKGQMLQAQTIALHLLGAAG